MSGPRRQTHHAEAQPTVTEARARLRMLLTQARSLDHLTVESLARCYRVPAKEIEYELTLERQRRAAQ